MLLLLRNITRDNVSNCYVPCGCIDTDVALSCAKLSLKMCEFKVHLQCSSKVCHFP